MMARTKRSRRNYGAGEWGPEPGEGVFRTFDEMR